MYFKCSVVLLLLGALSKINLVQTRRILCVGKHPSGQMGKNHKSITDIATVTRMPLKKKTFSLLYLVLPYF